MVFTKPSQPCPPHITVGCKRHWQREEKRGRILWMWVLQFPFTVKLWDSRNWPLWLYYTHSQQHSTEKQFASVGADSRGTKEPLSWCVGPTATVSGMATIISLSLVDYLSYFLFDKKSSATLSRMPGYSSPWSDTSIIWPPKLRNVAHWNIYERVR